MRYRLYTLDHSSRVVEAHDLICGTTDEALALARAEQCAAVRELWLGTARVARLEPEIGHAQGHHRARL